MRDQWFHEARARLDWMASAGMSGAGVLELGSATGEFLIEAGERGLRAVGLETSAWAVHEAQVAGASAILQGEMGALRSSEHASTRFEAVAAFHVVEHLHDPLAVLAEVRESVMAPNSRVFLEVPNFASSDARRDPFRWHAVNLVDHVSHFTPEGISVLLARAGFREVRTAEITHQVYDPPALWRSRRRGWVRRGMLRASRDLLRAQAVAPASS
jgi:2-polyprenyl-3-methyl-5-hydroxy-6-metoxy-1,4-benzoquinol methylase